ncbi:hypothetical protein MAM1_0028d02256 [Mucor ambiguus]|uniref:C2H2-type domain-containing protein n=1 Tax=Mucor ambiguus TaxID=91626 RepID=A0A0C9M7B0_9FUNG|nr:hypothetical protein MAM1_0028d02256 [Mucor ambiguus]
MLKSCPKEEAFGIKMEELMKQALSAELQEMTGGDEGHPVDLATYDNDETTTEEELIQIIKKEPNEKPLSVRDCVANPSIVEEESESESLEIEQHTDPDQRHSLPQPNKTQNQESADDNGGDTSDRLNLPTSVPDPATPEPERPVKQALNEPVHMDLEATYQETLVDTKTASTTKNVYYTSVECKSCQITFNDNYGFRRHLNHVHPHDRDQIVAHLQKTSCENYCSGRSLRARCTSTPTPLQPPPTSLHKRNTKCNVQFKRQFRANLKLKHLKTIPLPEKYEKPAVDIRCRFCQEGGWKESEYRVHLLQRHSRELNLLSEKIADSNSERLKEAEATTSSSTAHSTGSTSNRSFSATSDSPTTTDPDIIILDIPYDPIQDISENQRRTYQFFQNYMLDIS